MPLRVARPLACIASSVTAAPESKRASRSARFTGCVWVRNGSNGIDFFMCGPRSLRARMWIGFCPPSKFARRLAPERAPQPLWPRPEVLPVPDPSPRPMRLRALREPGAGLRLCSPMRSGASAILCDLDQMPHLVDHATQLRRVGMLDRLADAAQPEGAQRVALALAGPVLGAALGELQRAHSAAISSG